MNGRERGIDVQRGAQTGRKRKKWDEEKSRLSHAPATPLFTIITNLTAKEAYIPQHRRHRKPERHTLDIWGRGGSCNDGHNYL
jgi:hypothetical protein